MALETYEAGFNCVSGEKGNGEGDDDGEAVRGVLEDGLSSDGCTVFALCSCVLFLGIGTADRADRVDRKKELLGEWDEDRRCRDCENGSDADPGRPTKLSTDNPS